MGDTCDNYHAGPHVSNGVLLGYQLHLHRGSQGIDVLTPEVNRAVWTHLISVAQTGTLADLDSVGASIWPQWWPQYVHAREGGVAAVRTALLALL